MTPTLFRPIALASLAFLALSVVGTPARCADLIENIPFSLIGTPTQQTINVPQFDPTQGILNSLTLSVTGSMQFVLEVFDSGPSAVSVTAQDTLSFNGTPLLSEGTFTSTIPANQSPYTFTPAAVSLGSLTESFGSNVANIFIGTGTLPFQLSVPNATVDSFSGPTTYSVLAFAGATGNVTADYAFTPAQVAAPEPQSFGLAGLALVAVGIFRRRKALPRHERISVR